MAPAKLLMAAYAWSALAITVVGLAWMFIAPPPSMRVNRDGLPHFTPKVEHPITGEAVSMDDLIRHYRGD
ncbi:MAG: hypothetical protein AUK37_09885 [Rhodobacterales bacterium CG2_30_65_12]|nr:MAG: hypothetical protein AUK37_09885 [Rhodobacterales bacterium CG2_30_65_12]